MFLQRDRNQRQSFECIRAVSHWNCRRAGGLLKLLLSMNTPGGVVMAFRFPLSIDAGWVDYIAQATAAASQARARCDALLAASSSSNVLRQANLRAVPDTE